MIRRDRDRCLARLIRFVLEFGLAYAGLWAAVAMAQDSSTQDQKPTGRPLLVRVVGPDTKPIAGAKIHASIWSIEPRKGANRDYVCDVQGETTVQLPKTLNIFRLWAKEAGCVPLFAHWEEAELKADENAIPEQFTFTLQKGTVIGGFVKTEDGQPIAGAKVEVSLRGELNDGMDGRGPNRVGVTRWLAEGDDGRITDAQGRWTLDNVPGGDNVEVSVRLSHPDYISDYRWGMMQKIAKVSTASLRQQTGTIVMARGIKVAGTVTDPEGNPVAGAVVVFGDDPYSTSASAGQKTMVRTDVQGMYRFPPLPPVDTMVTVIAKGWSPELRTITITGENPPVDFQLKPGNTLRLRFVDESGEAVPSVGVGIAGWRNGKSLYNDRHPNVLDTKIPVAADKNGVFQWTWAPPDEVKYSFWATGYRGVEAVPYAADGVEHEGKLSR